MHPTPEAQAQRLAMIAELQAENAIADAALAATFPNDPRHVVMLSDATMALAIDPADASKIRLLPLKADFAKVLAVELIEAERLAAQWNAMPAIVESPYSKVQPTQVRNALFGMIETRVDLISTLEELAAKA